VVGPYRAAYLARDISVLARGDDPPKPPRSGIERPGVLGP
jgi:hypothetical protein